MGIQINGQSDTISSGDGSLNINAEITATVLNQNVTGVITSTDGFNVGLTTFHSTNAFLHDVNSTGVITATSFHGDGTNLTGIDASSLKSGGVVKVQAGPTGAVITGIATATEQITVGDSFIKPQAVGLGTTTTSGRNAVVSTAPGTIIYNASLEKVQLYKQNRGWVDITDTGDSLQEFEATGGIVGEYTDPGPGKYYRTHTYTTSSTFDYTIDFAGVGNVDIVMVGGGGGGAFGGGGGGAGGFVRTENTPLGSVPGPASITVTVGGGGAGGGEHSVGAEPLPVQFGETGFDTKLSNPDNPDILTAQGGGAGMRPGSSGTYPGTLSAGGSGGGCGTDGPTAQANPGPGTQPAYTAPISAVNSSIVQNLGYAGGGPGPGGYGGGGGGGAGSVGGDYQPGPGYNDGGNGTTHVYEGGPANPMTLAAGGGGGVYPSGSSVGGSSGLGGGCPANSKSGTAGKQSTGSGGGGGSGAGSYYPGGCGGSGYCCIRYEVSALTNTAKATGGSVSFYNGKTIHVFTNSGTFTAPGTFNETVEYVIVGGGGGGGGYQGGGGGAGGYRTGTTPITGPSPMVVAIGGGGSGGGMTPFPGLETEKVQGKPGVATTWNSISAAGGGGGGRAYQASGDPGGSGGGAGGTHPGTPVAGGTGNTPPTSPPQGNPGGAGGPSSNSYSGGGGGATQAGNTTGTNDGGDGAQLPATFRSPTFQPTDTTNPAPSMRGGGIGSPGPAGKFYVAGGGGGLMYWASSPVPSVGFPEGGAGGGASGFMQPQPDYHWTYEQACALANTGGGGGGNVSRGGTGASGLVILAYPT